MLILSVSAFGSFALAKKVTPSVKCTTAFHEIGTDTPDKTAEHACKLFAMSRDASQKKVSQCRFTTTAGLNQKLEVVATYRGPEITHTSVTFKKETTGTDGGTLSILDKEALSKYTVSCASTKSIGDLGAIVARDAEPVSNVK